MRWQECFLAFAFVALLLAAPASASAGAQDDIGMLKERLAGFIGSKEVIIIKGAYASAVENALFYAATKTYSELSQVPMIDEEEYSPELGKGKVLVLVGGPVQNGISKELMEKYGKGAEEIGLYAGRVVLIDEGGVKAAIFSDNEGFEGIGRNLKSSPLAPLVGEKLVPAAATGIGATLLIFWKFLVGLFTKVAKFKAASKIMKRVKKRELKRTFLGRTVKGVRIKAREWIAIFISAVIFALSLSYIHLSPGMDIPAFLLITVIVNFIVYSIRHGMRLIMDRHYGHHTEYHLWFKGAVVTAITGWLGNTFSLAGYTVSEGKIGSEGKINYIINVVTFAAFIAFWIWNFLAPNLIIHMAMLLTLAIAFLQMLPVSPFSGKGIFAWNRKLWALGFIPLFAAYMLVNVL